MKKLLTLALTLALALTLTSCALHSRHRGHVFPTDLYEQVAGITTVAQLTEVFGHPTARTLYGDNIWIYYGARENYHGPFPLTWDQRTVVLAWINAPTDGAISPTTRVNEIRVLRDDDLPNVRIARGETPIPAAIELNMFQELINNVGRFTPAGLGQ